MSQIVISAEGVGKSYIIGHQHKKGYRTLRDVMTNSARQWWSRLRNPHYHTHDEIEEFWALKDVNFEIQEGERVGIIGRNGAGKSTLLKILSRITEPTAGRVKISGRVASLLEIGTGFHPELSGRENIYLNGAILGMSRAEIKKKYDEIVDFAEVEKFLDTPVKRYSSGMYVRLAFAVAAHLEPEILVVDEVLAVGDAQFQKKCLGKLEDVGKEGRTVLFVSHNMAAIQRLCSKGILLESGNLRMCSDIPSVLESYHKSVCSSGDNQRIVNVNIGEARFTDWNLLATSTKLRHSCYSRDTCRFSFTLVSRNIVNSCVIGFAIWDMDGKLIFAASSQDNDGKVFSVNNGVYQVVFKVRLPLKADIYQLDISLNDLGLGQLDRWAPENKLTVLPKSHTSLPERWYGLVNEETEFDIVKKN